MNEALLVLAAVTFAFGAAMIMIWAPLKLRRDMRRWAGEESER